MGGAVHGLHGGCWTHWSAPEAVISRRSDYTRNVWFKFGVEAFAAARPDAPRLYCCPLCIRGFDDPGALSFEDVPPKSGGGKPLVLTCTECNNTHGSLIDVHIKRGRDLKDIVEGRRPTWARLRLGENEITAKARLGGDKIEVVQVPGKSNPVSSAAFASELGKLGAEGSTGFQLKLQFSTRHDAWVESVSWLRAAYLYLFALLGYNFILRPELNPVRNQFLSPGERLVPQVIKHMTETSEVRQIVAVSSPSNLRGFAVRLGEYMLFLPGFVEADSFYEKLAELPAKGRLALSGKALQIPTRPMFICDYHPDSIRQLVPPQPCAGDAGSV